MPPQIRIDVWEDFTCPFSFIEEATLDELHRAYGDSLHIERHPFELRRNRVEAGSSAARELDAVWRAAVMPLADRRKLALDEPLFWPASRKALEAAEFARARRAYLPMHKRLFEAFFRDHLDISDPRVLLDLAVEAGTDPKGLETAIENGEYLPTLRKETGDAERLGIDSAPTLLVRSARGALSQAVRMPGAVEARTIRNALEHMLRMQKPKLKPKRSA